MFYSMLTKTSWALKKRNLKNSSRNCLKRMSWLWQTWKNSGKLSQFSYAKFALSSLTVKVSKYYLYSFVNTFFIRSVWPNISRPKLKAAFSLCTAQTINVEKMWVTQTSVSVWHLTFMSGMVLSLSTKWSTKTQISAGAQPLTASMLLFSQLLQTQGLPQTEAAKMNLNVRFVNITTA